MDRYVKMKCPTCGQQCCLDTEKLPAKVLEMLVLLAGKKAIKINYSEYLDEENVVEVYTVVNPRHGIEYAILSHFIETSMVHGVQFRLIVKAADDEEEVKWFYDINAAKVSYGHRWQQPGRGFEKAVWREMVRF